ncbi:MAG TPA: hypothetical protein VFV51_11680 [Vicinamibacterales bacterium]|nr:hypothetical protein [Vicinamibacterales bacterium]
MRRQTYRFGNESSRTDTVEPLATVEYARAIAQLPDAARATQMWKICQI